jgi:hypothetical protein
MFSMKEMLKGRLTQERLKEVLLYDPETGDFKFRFTRGGIVAGSVAGARNFGPKKDRIGIKIDRVIYYASNLAWFYVYGEAYPKGDTVIDHKDGDPYNNRLSNLRIATNGQNMANRGVMKNNRLGEKCIHLNGRKYDVRIMGKLIAKVETLEEARVIRDRHLPLVHGKFTPSKDRFNR